MGRRRIEYKPMYERKQSATAVKVEHNKSHQTAPRPPQSVITSANTSANTSTNTSTNTMHGTVVIIVRIFADATNASQYADTEVTTFSRSKLTALSNRFELDASSGINFDTVPDKRSPWRWTLPGMDVQAVERVFKLPNQVNCTKQRNLQEIRIGKKLSTIDQVTTYEVLQYLELKGTFRQQNVLHDRIKRSLTFNNVSAELVLKLWPHVHGNDLRQHLLECLYTQHHGQQSKWTEMEKVFSQREAEGLCEMWQQYLALMKDPEWFAKAACSEVPEVI